MRIARLIDAVAQLATDFARSRFLATRHLSPSRAGIGGPFQLGDHPLDAIGPAFARQMAGLNARRPQRKRQRSQPRRVIDQQPLAGQPGQHAAQPAGFQLPVEHFAAGLIQQHVRRRRIPAKTSNNSPLDACNCLATAVHPG